MNDSTRRQFLSTVATGLGLATFKSSSMEFAPFDALDRGFHSKPNSQNESTRYIRGRVDNDLVATFGTCYQPDFRFFTYAPPRSVESFALGNYGERSHGPPHVGTLAIRATPALAYQRCRNSSRRNATRAGRTAIRLSTSQPIVAIGPFRTVGHDDFAAPMDYCGTD